MLDESRLTAATAADWQARIGDDFHATHPGQDPAQGARDARRDSNWRTSGGGAPRQGLGFLDLDRDLVIALRDVAGLAWGASDFGGSANGDFMHFDCRHDYSRAQLAAAMHPAPAAPATP